MTRFPLRLSDDIKEQAVAQAEAAGVSLNRYIAVALAARVGAARGAEGKAIPAKTGNRAEPRREDRRDDTEQGAD